MPVQRVTTAATSSLRTLRILDGALVRKRHRSRRFVDEIDRFVRQKSVGNEASRELRGGLDRRFVDRYAVMSRVSLAQTAKNFDRFIDARLLDHDRLKAAFERGIRFDVLAILIERRRTDALQVAAGELGFDHRA